MVLQDWDGDGINVSLNDCKNYEAKRLLKMFSVGNLDKLNTVIIKNLTSSISAVMRCK